MHHPKRVASLHNTNNDPRELSGLPLTIMPPLYDPIKELPSSAELHDNMHAKLVLICALDCDDILMPGEMVHDLDLPANILNILLGDKFALGDGFAGVVHAGGDLGTEIGGAKLALAKLTAKGIEIAEGWSGVAEDVVGLGIEAFPHGDGGGCGSRGGGGGGGGVLHSLGLRRLVQVGVRRGAAVVTVLRDGGVLGGTMVILEILGGKRTTACVAHEPQDERIDGSGAELAAKEEVFGRGN